MKKIVMVLVIFFLPVFLVVAQNVNTDKNEGIIDVVDLKDAQDTINRLTEENNKLTSENNKLKSQNNDAEKKMGGNDQTISKVDKLLDRIEKENSELRKRTDIVVDRESHNIATSALQKNELTRQKLKKLKKDLKAGNQGHNLSNHFRNSNINSNNAKIKKNNDTIARLNTAMKKSTNLKNDIKSHSNLADKIGNEADNLLKRSPTAPASDTGKGGK